MQTAVGASEAPQVLEPGRIAKSPVATMLAIARGVPPLFVRVTVCEGVVRPTPMAPKIRPVVGEIETPGGARPIPDSVTVLRRNWSEIDSVPA